LPEFSNSLSAVMMKFSPPSVCPDFLGSSDTHNYPCISSFTSSSSSEKL
jgi:hypothetical protein